MFDIACSQSNSYASHMVYRLIQAWFLSPGGTLAQGVIVDMFFANERGRRMVSTACITRIA